MCLLKCTAHFRRLSHGRVSRGGRGAGAPGATCSPKSTCFQSPGICPVLFEALCNSSFKTILNLLSFFLGVICVYHGDHWQRAKSGDRISLINKVGRASSSKFCGRLRTSAWLPKATLANLPVALSPTGPLARPTPTLRLAQGLMLCWGSHCSTATSHLLARFQAGSQADRADLSPGPAGRRPHPPPGARSF